MTFPVPCPVCGATDEHAAWRATVTGSPCTYCPHPGERGHGTGCCCAGRSKYPFDLSQWAALEREQRGIGRPPVPVARCYCGCDYTVQDAREP